MVRDDFPREYPPVPLVGVGALIVKDGRVIVVRRGKPPAMGEWSIPGGLVEVGETLEEAAAREALEETGLTVEPSELVEVLERIFPDGDGRIRYHYVLVDFLCTVISGDPTPGSDVLEAKWAEPDEFESLNMAQVTTRVIHKALEAAENRAGGTGSLSGSD